MTTYGTPDPAYTAAQIAFCKPMISAIEAAGITVPPRMVASLAILASELTADLNAVDRAAPNWTESESKPLFRAETHAGTARR